MRTRTAIAALALAVLAACGGGRQRSEPQAAPASAPAAVSAPKAAPAASKSAAALKIPPGHIPPAGKCRHWYPGKPPGQQPPVGECAALMKNIPTGAVLVRG